MNNKKYVVNTLLTVVVFVAMAVLMVIRTFQPAVVLPRLNIPNMVLLSLIALVAEHYLARAAERCYLCIALLSFATFGLLSFLSGYAGVMESLKLALVGTVVFTVVTFLYTSITQRLLSGPKAHAAALLSAVGLYLASQVFAGIIL